MDAKKATLPAAALVISLGSFAVGQQAAKVTPAVQAVALTFDPSPMLSITVKAPDGLKRRRLLCGAASQLDGKPAPSFDKLCIAVSAFTKQAKEEVGSRAVDLSK